MSKDRVGTTDVEVQNETNPRANPQVNPQHQLPKHMKEMSRKTQEEKEPDLPPFDPPVGKCIFTGKPAQRVRVLNGQLVYISDDLYGTSLGKIAQRINELRREKLNEQGKKSAKKKPQKTKKV